MRASWWILERGVSTAKASLLFPSSAWRFPQWFGRGRPGKAPTASYHGYMSNLPPPPPPPPPGGGRGQKRPGKPDRSAPKNNFDGGSNDTGDSEAKPGFPKWGWWIVGLVALGALLIPSLWPSNDGQELSYTEFITQVEQGNIENADINTGSGKITGEFTNGDEYNSSGGGERGVSEADEALLRDNGVQYEFTPPSNNFLLNLLGFMLPIFLIIGFLVWMQRRASGQMGGVMSIGKSKAKAYTTDKPSTTFDDIAGYEGVKQEISEVVDFLRYPERFKEIGARVPKGMLLVGPPGTGKTLFARAVAGEAGVGFLSVTGSDFMEMFVGVGASRVRDLFQQARRMGRAIIFIDEIDSIGRKRGAGLGGGHDEREQTLNQMLAEMDGFETSEGIVIMAATNRPDILDPALLRPGRFDRQIVVPVPEANERKAILEVHSRDKRIGSDVDMETMAKATVGMAGADLANLVNEAALVAVRRGSKEIERIDFENARDRVVLGAQRESVIMTAEEKRATAYHEGGHALLATVLPNGDPLHKVTILPRGMALGVTWSLPQERHTYSKEYFEDTICKAMGGRAAELVIFGHLNSGAANDLEQATGLEWPTGHVPRRRSDVIGSRVLRGHRQDAGRRDLQPVDVPGGTRQRGSDPSPAWTRIDR